MRPTPRPFQAQDVDAVMAAHERYRCVLGRAATGLGKAFELAMLAERYQGRGRVLILVDVKKLVRQIAETVTWYTGMRPGIEMADEIAMQGGVICAPDPIVVATVQTMYSGREGAERYRRFAPGEFAAVLLDECELFMAPKARSVVDYFIEGNAEVRVFGCTATPFRTDNVAMANLFEHVAFDRDILWGIAEGYLVPGRQAFVKVSVDFTTLKVRKTEEGDADYSDADVADRLRNEEVLVELAKGIIHVAEDRRSIVVCPDVASAKAVRDYLNAERHACADVVYGEMTDEDKDDVMARHQAGSFQFLTSVMMLTKGYDDPSIRAVFNCRKTRSKRLYTQILGRGTRPLKELAGVLSEIPDAGSRRAVIAASAKPDMLMVNMVGVRDSVRDITLVDILGTAQEREVLDRAKELEQAEGLDADAALDRADAEIEAEQEAERMRQEAEYENRLEEEEAAAHRRAATVHAEVHVEYRDGLGSGGGNAACLARVPAGQLSIFRKAKIPDSVIAEMSPQQTSDLSREVVRRWKLKLCSYKQGQVLRKFGYTQAEIHDMKFDEASAAIDAIARNNWQRPASGGQP